MVMIMWALTFHRIAAPRRTAIRRVTNRRLNASNERKRKVFSQPESI
jgi:hypothetical protein